MAKIPQDVTREDRLIGPLTLKQFLYLLGGVLLVFLAYQYHVAGYLFFIEFLFIALAIGGLAIALAFITINGLPFMTFLLSAVRYIFSPKLSIWHKDSSIIRQLRKAPKPDAPKPEAQTKNTSNLETLARVLDTGGKIDTDIDTDRIGALADTTNPVITSAPVEDILADDDEDTTPPSA